MVSAPLRIEHIPGLDLCLVATRDIEEGEIFLKEAPLVVTEVHSSQQKAEAALRAYCAADSSTQRATLEMFSPMDLDTDMHRETAAQASVISTCSWARGYAVRELQQALLVFRLNAHSFGEGRSAIFATASKFAHACSSNSSYSGTVRPGLGCHVATRPIHEGEMVTTNYLGSLSVMGTRRRQALLQERKLFRCGCARCVAPDWGSRIPCPACHP